MYVQICKCCQCWRYLVEDGAKIWGMCCGKFQEFVVQIFEEEERSRWWCMEQLSFHGTDLWLEIKSYLQVHKEREWHSINYDNDV